MTAADRWTWIDIVRRARLGRTTKGVAFLLATFADNDGSRVFPGVATVSVAAEIDYKTAKRAIAELVKAGLLERIESPGRVRGSATVYRLILAEDLLDRIEVLTPAAFELETERKRDANRRTGNARPRTKPDVQGTAHPVPDGPDGPGTGAPVPPADPGTGNGCPEYGERLSAVHNQDLDTTTTSPAEGEIRTAVTGPRASELPEDPFSDEKGQEPPRLRLVHPVRRGLGFCIPCYESGQTVVAADSINGDACAHHLRKESA